jgi:hypothetical protein
MSAEYSYDLFDDGADCAHDGHLVYGKIIRKKKKGNRCVSTEENSSLALL